MASEADRIRNRKYKADRRAHGKANNLCTGCVKYPPADGRLQCKRCLKLSSKWAENYRARMRSRTANSGACTKCFIRLAQDGYRMCIGCRTASRTAVQRLREIARDLGMCGTCRCRAPREGNITCDNCMPRAVAKRAAARKKPMRRAA